jgi:hypothetical protein
MQAYIVDRLWANIAWFPSLIAESFVAYYVWFCLEFNFRHQMKWHELLIPQVVLALNYFQVLPLPFRP